MVAVGDLVRGRGLIQSFGQAPDDFNAVTIVDIATDSRAAHLQVGWTEGTTIPSSSVEPARIDIDLLEARVALKLRGIPRGFVDELETVALVAPEDDAGGQ